MPKSKLMTLFREQMSKSKVAGANSTAECDVMYPTGFLSYDYLNGTIIHVQSENNQSQYKSIGIVDGSSNAFIGRPGCGKSTLVVQMIGNILREFPTANAYIDDIEGSLPLSRKEFLLGLSKTDLNDRVDFRNTGITTENVYERIKHIHDIKIDNRSEYEYDSGLDDIYGERIFKLIPTIYFIDSFAMLMPNDIATEDEMDNGMGATSTAKKNTQLVKKISQLLKEANIILFSINHILDDIQMGFLPKPVQIAGLKQGERISGGKAYLYIANNMTRLDEKGTLKAEEGYGITGTIVDATLVKSRTNVCKRSVPLIFNKSEGRFDEVLSLYHYLKTEGKIGGAGKSMYLISAPDIKFSQKDFKNTLALNKDLQQAFAIEVKNTLEKLLSDTKIQEETNSAFDINTAILALD